MPARSRTKQVFLPALAVLAVIAAPIAVQAADETRPPRNEAGEAELAKLLDGRIMGEPQNCLRDNQRRNMEVINRTAFVFRDGETIYVNRPDGASFLDQFDVPVFHIFGSDLCRMDRVELRGRTSGIGGPVVILNDFIPYTLEKEPRP